MSTFFCFMIFCVASSFAGEGWMTNLEKAKEQAAAEKKTVLVEFIGSDWCAPCKALKKDVFESPEFNEFAKDRFILVELDFPYQKEISEEQKAYNKSMQQKYNVTGFPTVFLMDDKGTVFWKRIGGGTLNSYLEELKQGLAAKDEIISGVEKAKGTEGMEKAKLLAAAYNAMSPDLKKTNPTIVEEVIALDKDDQLGFGKKKALEDLIAQQKDKLDAFTREQCSPLIREKKYDEAAAKMEEYLKTPDLTLTAQQMVLMGVARAYVMKPDLDKTLEIFEKVIKMDPESQPANMAKQMKERINADREKMEKEIKDFNSKLLPVTKEKE